MTNLTIRRECEADYSAVEQLTREAFWNHYVPGCCEHYVAHILRTCDAFVPELDLVAELDDRLVGNIMYTKANIYLDSGTTRQVLCFGPVSVLPEYQGRGVGTALIQHSMAIAQDMGFDAIVIVGDPDYYVRVGFRPAEEFGIATADGMYADALLARPLREGALDNSGGCFAEDPIFQIDLSASQEYDRQFSPKLLAEGGPSQQRFAQLVVQRRPRAL